VFLSGRCHRLAVYLSECDSISVLSFRDNLISGDGVFALSCALRRCGALSVISLWFRVWGLWFRV